MVRTGCSERGVRVRAAQDLRASNSALYLLMSGKNMDITLYKNAKLDMYSWEISDKMLKLLFEEVHNKFNFKPSKI